MFNDFFCSEKKAFYFFLLWIALIPLMNRTLITLSANELLDSEMGLKQDYSEQDKIDSLTKKTSALLSALQYEEIVSLLQDEVDILWESEDLIKIYLEAIIYSKNPDWDAANRFGRRLTDLDPTNSIGEYAQGQYHLTRPKPNYSRALSFFSNAKSAHTPFPEASKAYYVTLFKKFWIQIALLSLVPIFLTINHKQKQKLQNKGQSKTKKKTLFKPRVEKQSSPIQSAPTQSTSTQSTPAQSTPVSAHEVQSVPSIDDDSFFQKIEADKILATSAEEKLLKEKKKNIEKEKTVEDLPIKITEEDVEKVELETSAELPASELPKESPSHDEILTKKDISTPEATIETALPKQEEQKEKQDFSTEDDLVKSFETAAQFPEQQKTQDQIDSRPANTVHTDSIQDTVYPEEHKNKEEETTKPDVLTKSILKKDLPIDEAKLEEKWQKLCENALNKNIEPQLFENANLAKTAYKNRFAFSEKSENKIDPLFLDASIDLSDDSIANKHLLDKLKMLVITDNELRELMQEKKASHIPHLIEYILSRPEPLRLAFVAREIGHYNDSGIIDILASLLYHDDERVIFAALQGLANSKNSLAVLHLCPFLASESPLLAQEARKAILSFEPAKVLEALSDLPHHPDEKIKEAGIFVLSRMKGKMVESILSRLLNDKSENIRSKAILSMSFQKNPNYLETLRDFFPTTSGNEKDLTRKAIVHLQSFVKK